MSDYSRLVSNELGRAAVRAATGVTLAPSPFCSQQRIDEVAERLRLTGGAVPNTSELADASGTLYFWIGRSAIESADVVE